MHGPRLLLLDEPSMGLAPKLVLEIFRIIKELNETGVTDPAGRAERPAGAEARRLRLRARDRPHPHGRTPKRSAPATPSWRPILARELAQLLVAERGGFLRAAAGTSNQPFSSSLARTRSLSPPLVWCSSTSAPNCASGVRLRGVRQHAEQRDHVAARLGSRHAGANADVDQRTLQLVSSST